MEIGLVLVLLELYLFVLLDAEMELKQELRLVMT